jgi:NAD(P)-dependent dehydrogenase (short-subunit alcohol dehydrogenase family)
MGNIQQQWWITGAGAGLGRELALGLAAAGHRVYASSRSSSDLLALRSLYPTLITPVPVDVSNAGAMKNLWDAMPDPPTCLHGIILSAGICEYVDLPNLDEAVFRRVMDVNFFGIMLTCKSALPLLYAARLQNPQLKPRIIGIGSLSSCLGLPRAEAYGASKAAMHYFLDSLRSDIGQDIAVTVVQPGFLATRLTAGNDFAMPYLWPVERAAAHVLSRLWSDKPVIRFPWQLYFFMRLGNLFPGLWYGHLAPRLSRYRQAGNRGSLP